MSKGKNGLFVLINILAFLYASFFFQTSAMALSDVDAKLFGLYSQDQEQPEVPVIADSYMMIQEGKSSPPECYFTMGDILLWMTIPILGYKTFKAGIKLYQKAKASSGASKWSMMAAALSLIVTGAALALTAIMGTVPPMCLFSYVRNPIQYYSEYLNASHPDYQHRGKMKKRVSAIGEVVARFEPTDKFYEADPAPYADKLHVCLRYPNLINLGFSIGCETGDHYSNTNGDLYKGKDSRLCPEEWHALGIASQVERVGDYPPDYIIWAKKDGEFKFYQEGKYDSTLLWYKENSSPIKCGGPFVGGEKVTLHGYTYRIKRTGDESARLCATLVGYGAIPYSREFIVGCHSASSGTVYPQCSGSVPIREDGEWDEETNTIVPGTGVGTIIGYDNTACYGCTVSASCVGADMRPHQSFVPFGSIIYRCIVESFQTFINGCYDSTGEVVRESYIQTIQERLSNAVKLTISLGIAFFLMNIALGGARFDKKGVLSFVLKVSLVIFFTFSENGKGGLQEFAGYAFTFSSRLVNIVLSAALQGSGLCLYDYQDYIYERTVPGGDGETEVVDYTYLQSIDQSDCLVMFLMGAPLIPLSDEVLESDYINVAFVLKALLIIIGSLLGGPFFPILILALFVFVIMLFILFFWIVKMLVLSALIFSILMLLSPIFIPMVLFGVTKPFFDGWIKESFAYLMLPVIIMAYAGFILVSFIDLYFGETQFVMKEVVIFGKKTKYFFIEPIESCMDELGEMRYGEIPCGCDRSKIGCQIAGFDFVTKHIIFDIPVTGIEVREEGLDISSMALDYLAMTLLAFLYYHLLRTMMTAAVDMLGGARSIMALDAEGGSPQEMGKNLFTKAAGGLSKYAKLDAPKDDQKGGGKDKGKTTSRSGVPSDGEGGKKESGDASSGSSDSARSLPKEDGSGSSGGGSSGDGGGGSASNKSDKVSSPGSG